jgi:hypothetical protein
MEASIGENGKNGVKSRLPSLVLRDFPYGAIREG